MEISSYNCSKFGVLTNNYKSNLYRFCNCSKLYTERYTKASMWNGSLYWLQIFKMGANLCFLGSPLFWDREFASKNPFGSFTCFHFQDWKHFEISRKFWSCHLMNWKQVLVSFKICHWNSNTMWWLAWAGKGPQNIMDF